MSKIIDFSAGKRRWGHDFSLCRKLDEDGYRWQISMHTELGPNVGDVLLLGLNHDDTRACIVTGVEWCGNPHDMYFVDVNFKGALKKYQEPLNDYEDIGDKPLTEKI